MSSPSRIGVTIHRDEAKHLLEISQLFLNLSLILQGVGPPLLREPTLTRLGQLRPLLERFGPLAVDAKMTPPVEVFDFMAQKTIADLATLATALRLCTTTAHFFQNFIMHIVNVVPQGSLSLDAIGATRH